MINSVARFDCESCGGAGLVFFGNENDYDVQPCDCVAELEEQGQEYSYAVTCSYDGEKPHWIGRYSNALEAVNVFNQFTDWGNAKEYSTVNLSEPSGKMHTKNFYTNGKVVSK